MTLTVATLLAGQWVSIAFSFVSTVFVSRLLTPHELGVFVVAMAVLGFIDTFQNFGLREFIVQKPDLATDTRRVALGVSLITGVLSTLAVLLLAGPVSRFYDSPEIADLMMIAAICPLISALASPISSMLHRDMLFQWIGVINTVIAAVNATTAVSLTLLGFGVYSLAIALVLSTIAGALAYAAVGWRFRLMRPLWRGGRSVASYGLKIQAAALLSYIQHSTTELIIGRMIGLPQAALFQRASSINAMFANLLARAIDPLLTAHYATSARSGASVSAGLFNAIGYMTVVAWPFFGFAAIFADEIIRTLFGPQWAGAVTPMRVLCIASLWWPLNSAATGVLLGTGAATRNLWMRTVTGIVRIILTVGAAPFGLVAVSWMVVISAVLVFVLATHGAWRCAPFKIRDYLASLGPSLIVALFALLPAAVAYWAGTVLDWPFYGKLIAGAAATAIGWCCGIVVARHPLLDDVKHVLQHVASRRRAKRSD